MACLAELGDTPDEVASTLRSTGVQGIPRDNRSCAVALYLSALVGTHPCIRSVTVGHCSLMLTLVAPADARPAGRLWVQLPKPVRGFVAAFDTRQYPEVTRNTTAPSPRGAGQRFGRPHARSFPAGFGSGVGQTWRSDSRYMAVSTRATDPCTPLRSRASSPHAPALSAVAISIRLPAR